MWIKFGRWLKRPQWSLRSLLIAFVLVMLVCGWFARKCSIAYQSPVMMLGPITSGTGARLEPPSDTEIASRVRQSEAFAAANSDFAVAQVVKLPVNRYVDAPRTYPLVGDASLYHQIYWCILIGKDGWVPRLALAYVDQNHLHMTTANRSGKR